jgi:dihydrofolate reductase
MGRIVVAEFLTLDGVMQAPGDPAEDLSGGFEHGGWNLPYADEVLGMALAKAMASTDAVLFGRKTFEFFAGYWPSAPDDDFLDGESLKAAMGSVPKYVVSTTLKEPLSWQNSTLLTDVSDVSEIRDGLKGDLRVIGSGELVRSLIENDLVDVFELSMAPLVLGSGKRLFGEDTRPTQFDLIEATPTSTGALLLTYGRAKE